MSPRFSEALLRTQSDERLAALAGEGHERAFVVIVERYRRPLYGFSRGLAPAGRAEDVLQQAFLNAWSALQRGAEIRHVRGWLHQIVRHVALAAHTPGEDPLPDNMLDTDDPSARVEERLLIAQTLRNLAALPDHQREAIVKTAMEGRSRGEVASSLGVTEGAVRSMLHRARATLRAAATAITPLPLAAWAAGTAERTADVAAGGGAAGLAGAAAKLGTVAAVTGAVATTVAVHHERTPTQSPTAGLHPQRVEPVQRATKPAVVRRARPTVPLNASASAPPAVVPQPTPAPAPTRRIAASHAAPAASTLTGASGSPRDTEGAAPRPTSHAQPDTTKGEERAVVAEHDDSQASHAVPSGDESDAQPVTAPADETQDEGAD